MTELQAVKVKVTLFFSAVLYAVGVAVYINGFMVAAEKDLEHLKGTVVTIQAAVADINRSRWTSEAHDRYAREIERRFSYLEKEK